MFRPRIIPVLLLRNNGLVKTIKFNRHRYIGDPINTVKIFNDLKADELVFLDISATRENRVVSVDFVKKVGEEANMPFAVGGGVKSLEDIRMLINAGAEKVIINTAAARNPNFIKKAADTFGSSTIVVCIDVKKNLFGKLKSWSLNGKKSMEYTPDEFSKLIEKKGAGEIILQSISNDGVMNGYDLKLLKNISDNVTVPIVALGGARNLSDISEAYNLTNCTGFAAGSMFVYHGPRKGVLINYPTREEIRSLFKT